MRRGGKRGGKRRNEDTEKKRTKGRNVRGKGERNGEGKASKEESNLPIEEK